MGTQVTQLWKLDATAQAALVRDGEVAPGELVALARSRAQVFDESVRALVHLDLEGATHEARGPTAGPFAGVPCVLKDLLPYPGLPCAFGSRLFAQLGHVPTEHLPYTRALDDAGLIIIGKSTTSEFGLLGSTESLQAGVTRNPWDPARSATGSSGGAAAAVAVGIVPIAHASDGGGSIRIPAAVCGLFGFKPSAGRCVRAVPMANEFTTLTAEHCVTRSVRDSARWLACTERRDDAAPHAPIGFVEPADIRPLRIGVFDTTLMGAAAPPGGAEAVVTAAHTCEELGHEVEPAEPLRGQGPRISEAFFTIAAAAMHQMASTMEAMLGRPVGRDELEPFTWALIEGYRAGPSDALDEARGCLAEAASAARAYQSRWDLTLSPTIGVATPQLGWLAPDLPRDELISRTEQLAAYTPVHNMAGAPAMSVPLVHGRDGLPVGVHFAAAPGADALLLRLAYQLEEASPWRDRWPELAERGGS